MLRFKRKEKKEEPTFQRFSVADQIAPAIFEEEIDYIRVGEGYERILCMTDYPSGSYMGFLSKLVTTQLLQIKKQAKYMFPIRKHEKKILQSEKESMPNREILL
ncbi:hypothetical protein [Bacillus sp. FSL K6-2944]|uniref:hypothetical protein n=1 Tax=Bacillus sp. FSL K6-2944 TaxID=2921486 RepID=UPI0030FCD267